MGFDHIKNVDCSHCAKRFTNVFCNPENDYAHDINEQKTCTAYKKGEYIFKEGTRPHGIFCVNYGKIKLSKIGTDGKEQILRLVKPGDPLGYRSLLSGDNYNSSAIAIEDSGVCFISKEMFMSILQRDNSLAIELIKLMSENLKKTEIQLTHIAQNPVRERVAEALLFIKETYGFEADGVTINASFTREEIANIVGTATETAIRLLSEFSKDGIIKLIGKRIQILNLDKLVRTSHIND